MAAPFGRLTLVVARALFACAVLACAFSARAGDKPYDEKADASELVRRAFQEAKESNRTVLVVFGANWCPDCRALDTVLHSKSAEALAQRFVLVKVDVGTFDKNLDIAKRFDVPLNKGIPAVALVDGDEKLRYVTRGGELAEAKSMGGDAIVDFFNRVLALPSTPR